ncbi:MAG: transposase [Nitrospirota bacterium]
MNRRTFTAKQIKALLKNEYVAKCSEKAITYTKEFKLLAVERHRQSLTAAQIFRDAGFDLELIGKNLPYSRMNRWLNTYKLSGPVGFSRESRGRGGGRPKTRGLTDTDKIKRLETEVAYLKAENHFFAKLRALKKRENYGRATSMRYSSH